MAIIGAILSVGLLIAVHEWGHYWVAKRCGMSVDRFSIGFGPTLIATHYDETEFTIGLLPFGGYVSIAGMNDMLEDTDPDDTTAYPNRPAWQRFLAVLAGPLVNYIAAIFLAFTLYLFAGTPNSAWQITDTQTGYDAQGKLQKDDVIISINGHSALANTKVEGENNHPSALIQTYNKPNEALQIEVVRQEETLTIPIVARWDEEHDLFRLGVTLQDYLFLKPIGIGQALYDAIAYPFVQTGYILGGLYQWATNSEETQARLIGPVGITSAIKKQFETSWTNAVSILMHISVFLGLFNLLPLPALDGGRLLFLSHELITRRRINPKTEASFHMVGVAALLILTVIVTYRDITQLF